jgi:Na+-driven multidrug efflux pump
MGTVRSRSGARIIRPLAITTMAGQNMGAGEVERAAKTARTGALLGAAANALAVILVQAFVGPLVGLFAEDPAIVEGGIHYLRVCCSLNCLAYAAMYELDCFATGVGDSLFAMSNALLHSVVVRLSLSWLLSFALGYGFLGLYWAEMLSPLPSFVAGMIYFRLGRWEKKRLVG